MNRLSTKTILHVVGARPNYMKIAPLMDALRDVPGVRQILVNTGQHYDEAMARGFIRELSLPRSRSGIGSVSSRMKPLAIASS